MKLVYDCALTPKRKKSTSEELVSLLEQFVKSGRPIARVDAGKEYKNPISLCVAIRNVIVKKGMPIKACKRGEQVYLLSGQEE